MNLINEEQPPAAAIQDLKTADRISNVVIQSLNVHSMCFLVCWT